MSGSDSEDELGLGELMPRSPSPEPAPNTFSTYTLPEGVTRRNGEKEVVIRLVGSHPLWGHHLWNTARATTSYLLAHPSLTSGKRILELGAGGALPSIACALAGAEVVATDYADESLMENIAYNASANGVDVHAVGHTWGKSVDEVLSAGSGGRYDVVILSDLMFNHSQHEALIKTLDATLKLESSGPSRPPSDQGTIESLSDGTNPEYAATAPGSPSTPCALVFLTHHRPRLVDADMAFMPNLASRGWGFERLVEEYTGPMFENDPGDERVRGTVHGFRCWRL